MFTRAILTVALLLPLAAHAEDMYAPERFGRTGFGTAEVVPARP